MSLANAPAAGNPHLALRSWGLSPTTAGTLSCRGQAPDATRKCHKSSLFRQLLEGFAGPGLPAGPHAHSRSSAKPIPLRRQAAKQRGEDVARASGRQHRPPGRRSVSGPRRTSANADAAGQRPTSQSCWVAIRRVASRLAKPSRRNAASVLRRFSCGLAALCMLGYSWILTRHAAKLRSNPARTRGPQRRITAHSGSGDQKILLAVSQAVRR